MVFVVVQIVRNQIHRYQSTTPVEYEKESDPTQEIGDHNDQLSTRITLAIIFTAFLISPMTECLGPVLELNVSCTRFCIRCNVTTWKCFIVFVLSYDLHIGPVSSNSIGLYLTGTGLHSNGIAFIVQPRKIASGWIGVLWNDCDIDGIGIAVAKPHRWLQIKHRARLLQKLYTLRHKSSSRNDTALIQRNSSTLSVN